jgi:tetratricopeptide (TPR) repeat protein
MRNHWISGALALALVAGPAVVRGQTVSDQLEKAAYQEKTAGDLDAAIKIYQGIIEQEKAARPAMAQAYYRIGLCLAKKGDKEKAGEAFRLVLQHYSDQKSLASAARKELAKLGDPAGEEPLVVQRRAVGKKITDFPQGTDLSTPETAVAAYHRASARMDGKALAELCWVKIDPRELERSWRRAAADDIKTYNQAQLDAEVVEVLSYGPDLAAVITLLKFPPGVGASPYSDRLFGRIDGQWKNLGEDRLPSVEMARENFEQKKGRLRQHFDQIRKARAASTDPRHVVEQLLMAWARGDDQAMKGLLHSSMSTERNDFREFRESNPDMDKIRVESIYQSERDALVITSSVNGDRGSKGPMVLTLAKETGLWVVRDIDLETPESVKKEIERFTENYPDTKLAFKQPAAPATAPAGGGPSR